MGVLKAKQIKTKNIDIDEALSAATEEELKRVNVNLPKSVYIAFRSKTIQNDISISSLIRQWVDDYITEAP